MDREQLESTLVARFDADAAVARVVARQARDLADSGRIESDFDYELTTEQVVSNLEDAPADHTLVERWNWWLGSLEVSHGGYLDFQVRPGAV